MLRLDPPIGGERLGPQLSRMGTKVARPLAIAAVPVLAGAHLFFGLRKFLNPYSSDLALYYSAALVGIHHGWSRIYDLDLQQRTLMALGPVPRWLAFLNPPPLAWLLAPLTALPLPAALALWSGVSTAALTFAWSLLAAQGGRVRWLYGAMPLALWPAVFGLALGQPVALIAAGLVLAWWLLGCGREVEAGLILVVLVLKPNIALLVPPCLLLAGHVRCVLAFAAGAGLLVAASVLSLGRQGLLDYLDANLRYARVADVASLYGHPPYTFDGLLGQGWLSTGLMALAAVLALAGAWRLRGGRPELQLAVGLVGSLLAAGYLHAQDLLLLALAVVLVQRARPGRLELTLLVVGLVLIEIVVGWMQPVVPFEVLVLGYLLWQPIRARAEARP